MGKAGKMLKVTAGVIGLVWGAKKIIEKNEEMKEKNISNSDNGSSENNFNETVDTEEIKTKVVSDEIDKIDEIKEEKEKNEGVENIEETTDTNNIIEEETIEEDEKVMLEALKEDEEETLESTDELIETTSNKNELEERLEKEAEEIVETKGTLKERLESKKMKEPEPDMVFTNESTSKEGTKISVNTGSIFLNKTTKNGEKKDVIFSIQAKVDLEKLNKLNVSFSKICREVVDKIRIEDLDAFVGKIVITGKIKEVMNKEYNVETEDIRLSRFTIREPQN
jgi:hypothetical protein